MPLKACGALWIKEKGGRKYLSGEIEIVGEKIRLFVYKNDKKTSDKQPDYRIMMPQDEEGLPKTQPPPLAPSDADEDAAF